MLARKLQETPRDVVYRTHGMTSGPITRLMSPSDVGQLVKPFVFLDLAEFDGQSPPMDMNEMWHPHSGIATVTVMLEGGVRFAETTGKTGILPAGSVEFMRAGNGVWHTGAAEPGRARAFQLWIALPPELENAPNASHYVMPGEVPEDGPVRVILGAHGKLKSPIAAPPMNYLLVTLKPDEPWSYHPPQGHTVGWVAVAEGALRASSRIPAGQMAVFEPSGASIDFLAEDHTVFVLGSAAPHPHELALGPYSVHTSPEALRQGHTEIRRIGRMLRESGTIGG